MSASHHFLHFLQPPPQNSSSTNNNSINNENIMRVWNLSLNRYQAVVPKAESEFANAQVKYVYMYVYFFIEFVILQNSEQINQSPHITTYQRIGVPQFRVSS